MVLDHSIVRYGSALRRTVRLVDALLDLPARIVIIIKLVSLLSITIIIIVIIVLLVLLPICIIIIIINIIITMDHYG